MQEGKATCRAQRFGAWHADWQAVPHLFICLCKLACPGLVSHVIVRMRANRCGIQPQSRLAAPSVHYLIFILFYIATALKYEDAYFALPLPRAR